MRISKLGVKGGRESPKDRVSVSTVYVYCNNNTARGGMGQYVRNAI